MPIIQRIEVRCDLMGFWLFYFMENEVEVWKDVVGYESLYLISNLGRVKRIISGKIFNPSISNGYPVVNLCRNNIRKTERVHALVSKAFIDSEYNKKGLVCNHKDFNKQNNNLSNLEVITSRENGNQKHLPSTSKFTGVSFKRNKWRSQIVINGKSIELGRFDTEIEASKYYEDALVCINEGRLSDVVIKRYITKGYDFEKRLNKWRVRVYIGGKRKCIGHFQTEDEAKLAYLNYKQKKQYLV